MSKHSDRLRSLADFLDANPGVIAPEVSQWGELHWYGLSAAEVASVIRAVGGRWDKNDPNESAHAAAMAEFTTKFLGWDATIHTSRSQVCTRVVVGTREVVTPAAPATEESTTMVDIVEWQCRPVLAGAAA